MAFLIPEVDDQSSKRQCKIISTLYVICDRQHETVP